MYEIHPCSLNNLFEVIISGGFRSLTLDFIIIKFGNFILFWRLSKPKIFAP